MILLDTADPADRIIIATAIKYGAQLISFDKQFREYDELQGLLLPDKKLFNYLRMSHPEY
jgi:predicted nucleic acid-binding protein